jgi:hypothetical protein
MTQSTIAVPRFVRVTVTAAMIVATSGMLEGAGLPIFSAIGGIVQNFAAAQSEAKRLRDKAPACLRYVNRAQCTSQGASPKRITLDRHSSLTDLTQRSRTASRFYRLGVPLEKGFQRSGDDRQSQAGLRFFSGRRVQL